MSLQLVLTAMLPEHLLLLGILGVLVLEIATDRTRDALPFTFAVVATAALAALWLNVSDFAGAPFPGQFSVDPAASVGKAIFPPSALPRLALIFSMNWTRFTFLCMVARTFGNWFSNSDLSWVYFLSRNFHSLKWFTYFISIAPVHSFSTFFFTKNFFY